MKKIFYCLFILFISLTLCACSKGRAIKPAKSNNLQPTTVIHKQVRTIKPVKARNLPLPPPAFIHKQWSTNINAGQNSSIKLTPTFTNNKAFIARNNGKITAIDINNGKTLWQINSAAPLSSGLSSNDTMLFGGTADGRILALRQQDGKLMWQATVIGDVLATPAANNDVVVVKTEVGNIRTFKAQNGQRLWDYTQQNPLLIIRGSSAPKIVDEQVICGFAAGELKSFSLTTGNIIWEQQINTADDNFSEIRMGDIIADPVISNNVAYVVSYQGNIAAIDSKNGNILWQKPMSSAAGLSVDTQNVYVTDSNNRLWALAKTDGNPIWHQDALVRRNLSGPIVADDVVTVGDTHGYVHWINKTNGKIVAQIKISGGGIATAPIFYNNALYVYSVSDHLVKFIR